MTAANNISSQLWLALRFDQLPLQVFDADTQTSTPIIVIEKQRVICANTHANSKGITHGMDATTATLLCDCIVHSRDVSQEQQTLTALMEELYQYSPYIESYSCAATAQSGLLLEISRCLLLFGGVVALTKKIAEHLGNAGFLFKQGLGNSTKAAWLLSYGEYPVTGLENKTLFFERLQSVSVAQLYDYPQAIDALEKTGFHTLGDIARQIDAHSLSSIRKRFGLQFSEFIRDVFSIEHNLQQQHLFAQPRPIYTPKEIFFDTLQFDFPISTIDQLQWPMEMMLEKLSHYLHSRQLECKHIEWKLYDIYHNSKTLTVYSDNAQRQWKLLYDLTWIQLEQQQLSFEVDTLDLICRHTNPVSNRSHVLDFNQTGKHENCSQNFAITAAKLKARLGEHAIYKLSYCDNHIPEDSQERIKLNDNAAQNLPASFTSALRPQWLLNTPAIIDQRPEGLYWRGYLTLQEGPERIHGSWWNTPTARDYFLAQRKDHLRLWIFQDLYSKEWYVHGIFG